jgi:hypothetical protein
MSPAQQLRRINAAFVRAVGKNSIFFELFGGNLMSYRTKRDQERLDNNFMYHKPIESLDQPARYEKIRGVARTLAEVVTDECPESREKALALTAIEESVMWANAAIARNEK